MIPMCRSRRSPRPFTAGIPPILEREEPRTPSPTRSGRRLWTDPPSWGPAPSLGLGGRQGWRERGAGRTEGPGPQEATCRLQVAAGLDIQSGSWHGMEQLSQPAHEFNAGGPRVLRGHSYKAQVRTHVHSAHSHALVQLAHICTHITACTQVHSAHTHTCTTCTHAHTHTPRQGCEVSWVQSGELITAHSPSLHMPSPAG